MIFGKNIEINSQPINEILAKQQLAIFGYKSHKEVCVRAFFPSDDPRHAEDKGRKGTLDFRQIEAWQREGGGGSGGEVETANEQASPEPSGNKKLVIPQNIESLPVPAVDQIDLKTEVWVFRVRERKWLAGIVENVTERFNVAYEWDVRLTKRHNSLLPICRSCYCSKGGAA